MYSKSLLVSGHDMSMDSSVLVMHFLFLTYRLGLPLSKIPRTKNSTNCNCYSNTLADKLNMYHRPIEKQAQQDNETRKM